MADNYNRRFRESSNSRPSHLYVGAPYNFVPFSDKVLPYGKNSLPGHDEAKSDLISGEISYEVVAQTEIIVDDGTGNFYKNVNGVYAIPGSTMRGLIRSNAQILSLSSFDQDIDDYELMYRNVAGKKSKLKDRYEQVLGADTIEIDNGGESGSLSILRFVRAGYVCLENGQYNIYDTDLDLVDMKQKDNTTHRMNYYILSERKISDDYIKSMKNPGSTFSYPFFVKSTDKGDSFITMNMLDRGFRKEVRNGRTQYKGTKNDLYKPYAKPCSYNHSGRSITGVAESGVLDEEGYAVSTGFMQQKKAVYIIPKVNFDKKLCFDEEMPVEIRPEDLKSFQIDIKKRENTLKQFGGRDAFDLPKEEGRDHKIPIFYIRKGQRLYFGFTPRLRLFYEKTVKKGLPVSQRNSEFDFARALFGYSTDADSYKTRVSFGDMEVVDRGQVAREQPLILGEPKPTSYMDYLVDGKTYNDMFKLRGVKQYWLRNKTEPSNVPRDKMSEKFVSKFKPLAAGTSFKGKVRFHNLTSDELGLLLWSMKLNSNSMMNVGKAKAFGYGVIKLNVLDVKRLDTEKAYNLSSLSLDPYSKIAAEPYIESFQEKVRAFLKIDDLNKVATYRAFFSMKDSEKKPNPDMIRFMKLGDKRSGQENEYQSRTKPLDTVDMIMKTGYVSNESSSLSADEEAVEVSLPAPELQKEKPVSKCVAGEEYEGIVSEVKGNNIKILVEGAYPVYKISEFKELIKKDDLNKKNAGQLNEKKVVMKYHGNMDDHKGWEFVKLLD